MDLGKNKPTSGSKNPDHLFCFIYDILNTSVCHRRLCAACASPDRQPVSEFLLYLNRIHIVTVPLNRIQNIKTAFDNISDNRINTSVAVQRDMHIRTFLFDRRIDFCMSGLYELPIDFRRNQHCFLRAKIVVILHNLNIITYSIQIPLHVRDIGICHFIEVILCQIRILIKQHQIIFITEILESALKQAEAGKSRDSKIRILIDILSLVMQVTHFVIADLRKTQILAVTVFIRNAEAPVHILLRLRVLQRMIYLIIKNAALWSDRYQMTIFVINPHTAVIQGLRMIEF